MCIRDSACPYAQSGTMYYDLGKYPEAIAAFKRAVGLWPSYGSYMLLGNSYVYTRDYEPSIEAYKKAIQIDPKNKRAYYQLGIAYDYQQRYEESIKVYNLSLIHISEPTRLLSISYAVFCLKKKN